MEDHQIVSLFWNRNEDAIRHMKDKYDDYLFKVAYNVLSDKEDSKEIVNDTYLKAWNIIPPNRPIFLGAFLAKILNRTGEDRSKGSS